MKRYAVTVKIALETEWLSPTPEGATRLADEWLAQTYGNINYKAEYFARELPDD
jgi:hypothetical protein